MWVAGWLIWLGWHLFLFTFLTVSGGIFWLESRQTTNNDILRCSRWLQTWLQSSSVAGVMRWLRYLAVSLLFA